MAHKKGLGSSRNGRDSNPKYLGVKVFAGQTVQGGEIIVRQRMADKPQPLPFDCGLKNQCRIIKEDAMLVIGHVDTCGDQPTRPRFVG